MKRTGSLLHHLEPVRPRLLDLFCGAGGCAVGYHRAGFDVVGVDIKPQPNYPYEFRQADALDFPLDGFDAIHASPPCQRYTTMGQRFPSAQEAHPDLLDTTRRLLVASGLPYAIENVMGARKWMDPMAVRMCGSSFGLGVHRHRLFECSVPVMVPPCAHQAEGVAVYGKLDGRRLWTRADGSELRAAASIEVAEEAMGIDWMSWDELTQAIPPAYTEHIGGYLMAALNVKAAA